MVNLLLMCIHWMISSTELQDFIYLSNYIYVSFWISFLLYVIANRIWSQITCPLERSWYASPQSHIDYISIMWCKHFPSVLVLWFSHYVVIYQTRQKQADDPTPAELSADSDDNLFECILSNSHDVLSHLLNDKTNHEHNLRCRRHNRSLCVKRDEKNFLIRQLFKDSY